MQTRIDIPKTEPAALKAMLGLDQYLNASQLQPLHKEFIKLRASQINGCSYCIDKHWADARKLGESERRLALLSAWRETPFFTEEEKAILALTESVTLIQHHVSDEVYRNAAKLFDENYLAQIIMAIITINAWNRIGITTGMQPSL